MGGALRYFAVTMICVVFMSVSSAAAIQMTADDIRGDENLKKTAMSLSENDGIISEKAVFVAVDGVNSSDRGTIDKPYGTIDYAIQKLPDTETVIYVRGGVYDQKIAVRKSGTAESYLTIKAYPGERPILESSSVGRIIDPNNNNYLCFDGLTVKAKADTVSSSTHGVEMTQGHHIIFRNMEIYNINVPDPTSSSVATHAFNLYGNNASQPISNILIENCYIHDMQTGWSEAVAVNGNSEYVNVINCRIADIGNIGLDFAGNFGACGTAGYDGARYCAARGNRVSNCVSPNARSYGLYNDGGSDNVFDRNEVYGCSGGIEIGSEQGGKSGKKDVRNIVITNNFVHDNRETGIAAGGYSITDSDVGYVYDVKVYNNTIVNNGKTEIVVNKSDNMDFRNNIICSGLTGNSAGNHKAVSVSFDYSYVKNLVFKNNIYYSPDGENAFAFVVGKEEQFGLDNWIDTTGIFADPMLESGYMLSEGSPAIGHGDMEAVNYIGSLDFSGQQRVRETLDAGCCEYGGGDVATTQSTSTTEVTTESTSWEQTETTTSAVSYSGEWNFVDGSWADKMASKTLYTVNGLTVRHNGSFDTAMGFKFDVNDKSDKTDGFYIRLSADKGDKITVYVNYNSSKEGKYVSLGLDRVTEGSCVNVESKKTDAKKTGIYSVSFDIGENGDYIIYTDSNGSGTGYYSRVILEKPLCDLNNDGKEDIADVVCMLKHIGGIKAADPTELSAGDLDSDGSITLCDGVILLQRVNKE